MWMKFSTFELFSWNEKVFFSMEKCVLYGNVDLFVVEKKRVEQ